MERAGLAGGEDFAACDVSIEGGYRSALRLLTQSVNRPTGIVAVSDEVAIGVMTAAYELGIRIPDELSVIGIDGHPAGEAFGLTTMVQHVSRQGAMAVSQALALLGGMSPESEGDLAMGLPVDLRIRRSTGPAPDSI